MGHFTEDMMWTNRAAQGNIPDMRAHISKSMFSKNVIVATCSDSGVCCNLREVSEN